MPIEFIENGDFSSGETGWTFTGNVLVASSNSSASATFSRGNRPVNGSIEQSITGLTPGQNATLSFEYGKVGLGAAPASADFEIIGQPGNVIIASQSLSDALGVTNLSGADSTDNFFTTTFSVPAGVTEIIIRFTDTTSNTIFSDFDVDNVSLVACFTRGTLIETITGPVSVENLAVDTLIKTANGYEPLRACCSKSLDSIDLTNPKLRPIKIGKGALGENLPTRDLVVSRQHRMVVRSDICNRMFNTNEVLVSAHRLTRLKNVSVCDDVTEVEYFHLIFDTHQVIYAEGAPTESFLLGPNALESLSSEALAEVQLLFPEMLEDDFKARPFLPIPEHKKQKTLIARIHKNAKAVVQAHM